MKKTRKNKWQINEDKANAMTDKFIDVLEKLDCYSSYETILIDKIIERKRKDAGINGKYGVDDIAEILADSFGLTVLRADSLAEQYKVEAFMSEIKANPYQLTLVA